MTRERDIRGGEMGGSPPIGEVEQAVRHTPPGRNKRGRDDGQGEKRAVPPIGEIAQAERDD